MKEFMTSFVEKLSISEDGDRFGIVTFSKKATVVQSLSGSAEDAKNSISSISTKTPKGTRVDLALKAADNEVFTESGDRAEVPNVLMVLLTGKGKSLKYPYWQTIPPLQVTAADAPR